MDKFIRSYIVALILCFNVLFCFSQQTNIPLSDVDSELRAKVYTHAFKIFTAKRLNDLPELSSKDFSKYYIREFANVSYELVNDNWYKKRYGDVKRLKLVEVVKGERERKIFRYKTSYTKVDYDSEIRFIVNKVDQIIGFYRFYFWSDDMFQKRPKLERITKDRLDSLVLDQHQTLAFKTYNSCKKEEMFLHTKENTTQESIDAGMRELNLEECDSIKQKNGDFKNLRFVELLKDDYFTRVYRFKLNFDNLEQDSEIRIYCDSEDKYTGIFVVDEWFDKYYGLNKEHKLDMTNEN